MKRVRLDVGARGPFGIKVDIVPRTLKTMSEDIADEVIFALSKAGIVDGLNKDGVRVFVVKRPVS